MNATSTSTSPEALQNTVSLVTENPVVYILRFSKVIGAPRAYDWETGAPLEQIADPKYCTAEFYVGYAVDFANRLHQHMNGSGAKLCAAAMKAGAELVIAAVFVVDTPEQAWTLEHRIKARKNTKKFVEQLHAGRIPAGFPKPSYIEAPPLHWQA